MIRKLATTILVTLAIAACGTRGPVSAPSAASAAQVADPASQVAAACYRRWTDGWQPAEGDVDERGCFLYNHHNNHGCPASSDGEPGCYKWATGAEAPALPWRVLDLPSRLAADVPPPLTHGLIRTGGACPFCVLRRWRAVAPTPLLAEPNADARIVNTIAADEWVTAFESFAMVSPRRGIVLNDEDFAGSQYYDGEKLELRAGDIVYFLYDSDADTPLAMVWRGGREIEIDMDDPTLVRWDPPAPRSAPDNPHAGWWVQMRRANGQTGWVRDPGESDFSCMTDYDPPDFCALGN